jgi:hypothetical protein
MNNAYTNSAHQSLPLTVNSSAKNYNIEDFRNENLFISNEIFFLLMESMSKLSKREKEIINNKDEISKLIKEKKIRIIIEIPEEEII